MIEPLTVVRERPSEAHPERLACATRANDDVPLRVLERMGTFRR